MNPSTSTSKAARRNPDSEESTSGKRPAPTGAAPRDDVDKDLKRKDAEIRRLRSLNTRMIASIHHPLLVVDPDLRISIANDAFHATFPGISEGGSLLDHFDPAGLQDLVAEVAESGKASIDTEMSIGEPDEESEQRLFRVSALPLTSADELPLVLLTIDEMTELRLREAQLLESSRLVAVGEMAASIAHELNNPLTAILGFSQLAIRQEMEEVLARDVEAIASEARRAGRIVDNLLSFARKRGPELKAFDPPAAVQQVLDLRQYECKVNNIDVVTYFDEDTPRTVADLHQLQQVFLNLLNNAIQAISDRRGHGTVTVGVVGVDDKVRVTFADDGPGIPPDLIPQIFKPFYTTKSVGKGTGLGLSICRNIIEAHGGTISVSSREGRGATFTLELPVLEAEAEENDLSLLLESADTTYMMLKVLVVDDEPALVEMMSRALRAAGHEVEAVENGAEAVQKLYIGDYDAVLLDVKMPGLGGQEVYRCIEQIRPELAERVLFVSGGVASPDVKTFIDSTGNPLLRKPFTLDDLRRWMDHFASVKAERTFAGIGN